MDKNIYKLMKRLLRAIIDNADNRIRDNPSDDIIQNLGVIPNTVEWVKLKASLGLEYISEYQNDNELNLYIEDVKKYCSILAIEEINGIKISELKPIKFILPEVV